MINYLQDLIWVGNTLLPRWFVLLIILLVGGTIVSMIVWIKKFLLWLAHHD